MISPVSPARAAGGRNRGAGFTLLEMIIVLVVLGLIMGLVISRGPLRSHGLELRAVASEVALTLRGARARAIARNENVRVVVDLVRHAYAMDGGQVRPVPPGVGLKVIAIGQETGGQRRAAIRFAPDGSSTGGTVELIDGKRRIQVGVDWLTGRVSIVDVS